jgi:hypothetical protein
MHPIALPTLLLATSSNIFQRQPHIFAAFAGRLILVQHPGEALQLQPTAQKK